MRRRLVSAVAFIYDSRTHRRVNSPCGPCDRKNYECSNGALPPPPTSRLVVSTDDQLPRTFPETYPGMLRSLIVRSSDDPFFLEADNTGVHTRYYPSEVVEQRQMNFDYATNITYPTHSGYFQPRMYVEPQTT